jgi:hypothetical protein
MTRLTIILVISAILAGCSKWSVDTEWRSGEFILIAIDAKSQMTLIHEGSSVTLVGPTIFAIGADDRYIVLKQHPAKDSGSLQYDRSVTNYYIVEGNKTVRGPLNKIAFDQLVVSLALPPFSKVFQELE